MAARSPSARRYAEAAFELASDATPGSAQGQNALDQWSADLRTIADFVEEADVRQVLASSRVPRNEKLRLLEVGLRDQVSPLAVNMAKLLATRGKITIVRDVQTVFQELLDERRGVAHATVTTAVALSDDERSLIQGRLSQLTGKQVDVTVRVDESIIGGVVARIGDQLIDGSTKSRLLALKRRIAAAGAI